MTDAFGVVALVALTPLIAVQVMGLQYRFKLKKMEEVVAQRVAALADSDAIVELGEDS